MTDTTPAAVERPAYLIRKHGGYYKPNSEGYTDSAILAGRYTLAEAESITHPNGQDGPRDGMTYIHENQLADPSWLAYAALSSQLTAANQRAEMLANSLATARADAFKAGKFSAIDAIAKQCWTKGTPPHPYASEWFIAKLDDGSKVVLRELHQGHSYDYTTRDETYIAAFRVAEWMQFPDSNFILYVCPPQEASEKDAAKVNRPAEPTQTVQEAANVLLSTMTTDRPTFDAMVEQAEVTHSAGASFNKVIGNALRAIAGGRE
jgi:hypothetical protein